MKNNVLTINREATIQNIYKKCDKNGCNSITMDINKFNSKIKDLKDLELELFIVEAAEFCNAKVIYYQN